MDYIVARNTLRSADGVEAQLSITSDLHDDAPLVFTLSRDKVSGQGEGDPFRLTSFQLAALLHECKVALQLMGEVKK